MTKKELEERLAAVTNQLLDLGKRNRLLNYKDQGLKTLTILNKNVEEVFRGVKQYKEYTFFPTDETLQQLHAESGLTVEEDNVLDYTDEHVYELLRKYKNFYRYDVVGLAAGSYTLKVAPVVNGSEVNAVEVKDITVLAHDRAGFGFVKGTSSGAYNDDGTLKSDAEVIYVTNENKDKVTVKTTNAVGIQNIIAAYKKEVQKPLCVRFIGDIKDPANMPKGDLYVDGVKNGLTLEGIGEDANLNGFGVVIKASSNVEVRNLGFMNCDSSEGDDCGLQQDNDHIWVHNCDFFYGHAGSDSDQAKGDGALDTKKSTYVTHSYNHF